VGDAHERPPDASQPVDAHAQRHAGRLHSRAGPPPLPREAAPRWEERIDEEGEAGERVRGLDRERHDGEPD